MQIESRSGKTFKCQNIYFAIFSHSKLDDHVIISFGSNTDMVLRNYITKLQKEKSNRELGRKIQHRHSYGDLSRLEELSG
jgi:hypothetical protein